MISTICVLFDFFFHFSLFIIYFLSIAPSVGVFNYNYNYYFVRHIAQYTTLSMPSPIADSHRWISK